MTGPQNKRAPPMPKITIFCSVLKKPGLKKLSKGFLYHFCFLAVLKTCACVRRVSN